MISVPLVRGGEVIGALNVHHRQAHERTPEEISLLCFLGEQLGGAIVYSILAEHNAKLYEDMMDRVVVTAEPNYLAQFTSCNQVISYQRRFLNAAKGQK